MGSSKQHMKAWSLLALALQFVAAEPEFSDSPALTNIWQHTSSGDVEQLINVYIQDRDFALARAADGRGPLFWAYEFKNVDALALLIYLEADEDAEDLDGKRPRDFFPDGPDLLKEFIAEAEAKMEEIAALLKEREEEYASYQDDSQDAYTDEDEGDAGMDEIDYADDEDDYPEDEAETEVSSEQKRRLEELKAKSRGQKDEP